MELASKLKKSDKIIWNLAGNGGGSSNYPRHFVEELNGYVEGKIHSAWLKNHFKLSFEVACGLPDIDSPLFF